MNTLFDNQAQRRSDAEQGQKVVYERELNATLPDGRCDGDGRYSFTTLIRKDWGSMTRCEKVLQVLYRDGTLTQKDAYERIGTTRLAARIHDLREDEDAPPIEKRMVNVEARDGETKVAEYFIPKAE